VRALPAILLPLLLGACATDAGDATEDTDSRPVDPDVATWVPEGYLPEDPVRLVYLGDSISAGYGATRSSLAYTSLLRKNTRWEGFADEDLETSYPSIEEVVDVSRGGATTDTLLSQQLPLLDAELGDTPAEGGTIVVFTVGGNDAQAALNPLQDPAEVIDAALANFEAIVDELTSPERFAGPVWLYATNVYEPSDGTGQVDDCFFGISYETALPELDRFTEELFALGADRGVSIVDLRDHFRGHGFRYAETGLDVHDVEDPTLWFADDCIHPNNRGHHEIRRLFHAAITGRPLRVELPE
jgi:lysophospholipase L1-like esterase